LPAEMTVKERAELISAVLNVPDRPAWVLALMYTPEYYANAIDEPRTCERRQFDHYLNTGVHQNISPSPLIDISHLEKWQQSFDINNNSSEESISEDFASLPAVIAWATEGLTRQVAPNEWFDEDYYHSRYPDLKGQVQWGFRHYATGGYAANRMPCNLVEHFVNELTTECPDFQPDLTKLALRIPHGCHAKFFSGVHQAALRKLFMAELYRAQNPELAHLSDNALFLHYVFFGPTDNARSSVLFHEQTYRKNLANWINARAKSLATAHISDTDFDDEPSEYVPRQAWTIGSCDAWLHWYFVGKLLNIIPTPLFDADYYATAHPELEHQIEGTVFEHFAFTGCYEQWRLPSPYFNASHYKQGVKSCKHDIPLLDYVLHGQFLDVQPVVGFSTDLYHAEQPLLESVVEQAAVLISGKTERLKHGVLADMVKKATALEPQLPKPYGPKNVLFAPRLHSEVDIMQVAERIQLDLPKNHYESIVLIPHCRMSGSARIAGQFAEALTTITATDNVLIISTDSDEFERPDWFPERMDIFNISGYFDGISKNHRMRALLDIVRGLRPSRLININSNLAWQLTSTYCRQLSEWMDIYFFLFCWDKDARGNKEGYPIEWFLPTFDHCKAVFTDSDVLTEELQNRYCPTPELKKKIATLHTPAENVEVSYLQALQYRGKSFRGKRRFFWSGRFDRQKRPDLLIAIAQRMPDAEFWIWGKAVLNSNPINFVEEAPNIQYMGTYTHIDDVPISSCDGFLYTAAWDGLPTVLIEVGSRAVPIVASAVGGVIDLIRNDTAWPVQDVDNPDAYVAALNAVTGNYPKALEKAQSLREHTLAVCNKDIYTHRVQELINPS